MPVRPLYQALRVAPTAYYARHRQQGCPNPGHDLHVTVREEFAYQSQHYGTHRLRAEVQAEGHAVGRWRIRRVLKAHGLRAQQPRSFVPRTTDSDPDVRETMPEDLVSEAPRPGRAPSSGRAHRAFGPGQPVHGHPLQAAAYPLPSPAEHEPAGQLLRQRPTGYDSRRIVLEPLQSRVTRRRQLSRLG